MRKNTIIVILCVLILVLFVGCGNGNVKVISAENTEDLSNIEGEDSKNTSNDEMEEVDLLGYYFTYDKVDIAVDMDMEKIALQLGEPLNYFEGPSCAAQGIAKIYTYANFEINTYPDGETDRIAYIILKDDLVATREGIDLSNSREEIIAIYGDDYIETDTLLKYVKDEMSLCFIFSDEELVSIEYDSSIIG